MRVTAKTVGEVGAAIRARRQQLGWDQAKLAQAIKASRLWVNQIERGKPGASLGLVLSAFVALDLSLTLATSDAAGGEGKTPAPVETPDISAILEAARGKTS